MSFYFERFLTGFNEGSIGGGHTGLPVVVDVLVGVVHAEGLVDGGALVHELDGSARVGRDVADGEKPAETRDTGSTGSRLVLPPPG